MIRGFHGLVNRRPAAEASAVACILTAALLAPAPTAAQSAPPPVALKTRDVGAYVGHFNIVRRQDVPYYYDRGRDTVLGTLGVGYYWTEHVKTEFEVGRTSAADSSEPLLIEHPGVPPGYRIYTNNRTTATVVTVAQSYQFFHNQWFHPFLTAGVDVAFERTRIEIPQQVYYPPPIYGPLGTPPRSLPPVVVPGRPAEITRQVAPRAFGGAGFKAYFTERAFFRTDFRIGAGRGGRTVVGRLGFGVDF